MKRKGDERSIADSVSIAPSDAGSMCGGTPALKRKRTLLDKAQSAASRLVRRGGLGGSMSSFPAPFCDETALAAHLPASGEAVIEQLCDVQGGLDALMGLLKADGAVANDVASTFKQCSSILGAAYASVSKLLNDARSRAESQLSGSALQPAWVDLLQHFAAETARQSSTAVALGAAGESIGNAARETDRQRKNAKQAAKKADEAIEDAMATLTRLRQKYEGSNEEWDRAAQEEARAADENNAPATDSPRRATPSIFRSRTIRRTGEVDARRKAANAMVGYKDQLTLVNTLRAQYYGETLPSLVRTVKDLCEAQQRQLRAVLVESAEHFDAGNGELSARIAAVDVDGALRRFVADVSSRAPRVQKAPLDFASEIRESMPSTPAAAVPARKPAQSLDALLRREKATVPAIVRKCVEEVERRGMDCEGIYRLSGVKSHVEALRADFDADAAAVDLTTNEHAADINSVTGVLKVFFRSINDGIIPRYDFDDVLSAARDRRLDDLRAKLSELPPGHKETLEVVAAHLRRVAERAAVNKMTAENLGVVLGPSLFAKKGAALPADGAQEEEIELLGKQRALLTLIVQDSTLI